MPNGDDSRRMRMFERTNAAGLETGDVNEYTIANVAAGVEFRATLTWFDPAAALGAASTLVNDLDLEVVDPNSATYLGNHFACGVSTTGGTADNTNTVEMVRFTAPVAGSYTIRVKGTNVPGDGSARRTGKASARGIGRVRPARPDAVPGADRPRRREQRTAGVSIGFTARPARRASSSTARTAPARAQARAISAWSGPRMFRRSSRPHARRLQLRVQGARHAERRRRRRIGVRRRRLADDCTLPPNSTGSRSRPTQTTRPAASTRLGRGGQLPDRFRRDLYGGAR